MKVEKANCTRYWFLVSTCDVRLSWLDFGTTRIVHTGFIVSLTSMNGTSIVPMRSAVDPNVLTSSAGLERLSNRAWTLGALSTFGLLFCGLFAVGLLRRQPVTREA